MKYNNINSKEVNKKNINKVNKKYINYLSASNSKYFLNNDLLGYNLKKLNILSLNDFINYIININNKKYIKCKTKTLKQLDNTTKCSTAMDAQCASMALELHQGSSCTAMDVRGTSMALEPLKGSSCTEQHNIVDECEQLNMASSKDISVNKTDIDFNNITELIFQKGINFEKLIIDKIIELSKEYKLKYVNIINGETKPDYNKYNEYLKRTKNAIKNNVDIIYQGMIVSSSNAKIKYLGFPDLMVNKRTFNKLFLNYIDKDDNFKVSLQNHNFKKYFNYIIIDIKSSSLQMNIDGITGRNVDIMKQYKCQLAVYGYIMEQNYKKKCLTYILPQRIKINYLSLKLKNEKYFNNPYINNFILIKVDIHDKDNNFYKNLNKIYKDFKLNNKIKIRFLSNKHIKQIKQLKKDNNIDNYLNKQLLDFNDDKPQFIPFLKGYNIDNYEIRRWIAQQYRSLTLIRGFTKADILLLNKLNIHNFLQEDKLLKWVNNNKSKNNSNIIETIIKSNNNNNIFFCKNYIEKSKELNDILKYKHIICLDFETIPYKILCESDQSIREASRIHHANNMYDINLNHKIFMIGCSIYDIENNILKHNKNLQYTLDDINNYNDINKNIINMFNNFKEDLDKEFVNFNDVCIIIWSQFEINIMKIIKNLDFKENRLFNIKIIDLLKFFSENNPVGINGAYDYSIKSIANGLLKNNLINKDDLWNNNNIVNGFNAMYYAILYYKNKNNTKLIDIFNHIKYYNIIDCKIIGIIINVIYKLLNNMIIKNI